MPDTGFSFPCPLCGVNIPLPHTDQPSTQGLTVTFSDTYVIDHMVMHADCVCEWTEGTQKTIVTPAPGCRFHGDGVLCVADGCTIPAISKRPVTDDVDEWVCEVHQ